jgi:hypothetical protein
MTNDNDEPSSGSGGYRSRWMTEFRCTRCEAALSFREVCYSHGRCPKCGVKDSYAGTICAVNEVAYRLVRDAPWWAFWVPLRKEYR